MSYVDFTLQSVKEKLDITHSREAFPLEVQTTTMPNPTRAIILHDLVLATNINTEKARSELIVMPMLKQVAQDTRTSLFSGNRFDVDPNRGLSGFIDFLISKDPDQMIIEKPILILIEAKNQNIASGYGQCIAEMYAAQQQNGHESIVYGCVTTGETWVFLELQQNHVRIDSTSHYITDIDDIYSIIIKICE